MCVSARASLCVRVFMRACMCVFVYTCARACVSACASVCVRTCVFLYICARVPKCVCMCERVRACVFLHDVRARARMCVCVVALCSTGPASFSVKLKFGITLSKLRTSKHFYKAASFNEEWMNENWYMEHRKLYAVRAYVQCTAHWQTAGCRVSIQPADKPEHILVSDKFISTTITDGEEKWCSQCHNQQD